MDSNSMSFDASVKGKRDTIKGLIIHDFRDVYERKVNHTNPNIDPARTENNQSFYYDADSGEYEPCTSIKQVEDALQRRLDTVKKKLRKDAVVVRGLILQLGSEWYENNEDNGEPLKAMIGWLEKTFGKENIVGFSYHCDEDSSPHLHILFSPVTNDGRLSQKDWFPNPQALREMHQDLRMHMCDSGFDVDMKNKKPGKYAKRMSEAEYRDYKQLNVEAEKIESVKKSLNNRDKSIRKKETELQERETEIKRHEQAVEMREKDLENQDDLGRIISFLKYTLKAASKGSSAKKALGYVLSAILASPDAPRLVQGWKEHLQELKQHREASISKFEDMELEYAYQQQKQKDRSR